jgi:hypothetical protein
MPIDVVLNVYDLIQQTPLCCGFFHTGVEILGVEYSFGQGGGIYECTPKSAPDGRFRESIVMGSIESTGIARSALDRVRPDFPGDAYNVIFRNCNDFSNAYVRALLNRSIPGRINRLARLGRMWPVRCFLPPHLKNNATSTTAPLLASQPQQQLFQGSGNSLSGSGGNNSNSDHDISGARRALSCISSRCRRLFTQRGSSSSGDASSTAALIQSEGDARELRAAAAARRLESADLEESDVNCGKSGAPIPNPWQ